MKRIWVTGKTSYIGRAFCELLGQDKVNYKVLTLNLREDSWHETKFEANDTIVYVAGIAHIKETQENKALYFAVNRDLTYAVAKRAKEAGVKHFVFLSSMSVYGLSKGVIFDTTPTQPTNAYGQSKLEAENLLHKLASDTFKVSVVRPPMVYGYGCKGNYSLLSKLSRFTPVFPLVSNQRSMIHIDCLTHVLKDLIDHESLGLICPQNQEYVNTSEMVKTIAKVHGRKIWLARGFNIALVLLPSKLKDKVFGDLRYDRSLVYQMKPACDTPFESTIQLTEKVKEVARDGS